METQSRRVYGVTTRRLAPTDHRGARVVVRDHNGRRHVEGWDHGVGGPFDAAPMHALAVVRFLEAQGVPPEDAHAAVGEGFMVDSHEAGFTFALPTVGFETLDTHAGMVRNAMVRKAPGGMGAFKGVAP